MGSRELVELYGAKKYDRLEALKRRDDPDNLFRVNRNISPPPLREDP